MSMNKRVGIYRLIDYIGKGESDNMDGKNNKKDTYKYNYVDIDYSRILNIPLSMMSII